MRAGQILDSRELVDTGIRLTQLVLETQNTDGSWYYFTEEYVGGPSAIDGYHTAMNLSALSDISAALGQTHDVAQACEQALERGAAFYIDRLFTQDGLPRARVESTYPLSSYAYAQGSLTLLDITGTERLSDSLRRKAADTAGKAVASLVQHMQDSDGRFITMKYRFANYRIKSLRWAQALNCRAMCRYILSQQSLADENLNALAQCTEMERDAT